MRRTRFLAGLLLAIAALAVAAASADQLAWLERDEAARAVPLLPPGTRFVEWISHLDPEEVGGRPVLYEVIEPRAIALADRSEVEVVARRLAVAEPSPVPDDAFRWRPSEGGRAPERLSLDLAYVYVPSTEVPGMFVNLARKLRLPCTVRWIAIEVPEAAANGPPPVPPAAAPRALSVF